MGSFNHLPDLPGTAWERARLRKRLGALRAQEETLLPASSARQPSDGKYDMQ